MHGHVFFLGASFYCYKLNRKHPSFSTELSGTEFKTILDTFLGASWVLPSETSLTGRSVGMKEVVQYNGGIQELQIKAFGEDFIHPSHALRK